MWSGGGGKEAPPSSFSTSPAPSPAAVRLIRFPGSPHCEHFRTDPAGYVAEMEGLLARVEAFRATGGSERGEAAAAA